MESKTATEEVKESKTRIITLTGRPPVSIKEEEWPKISFVERWDWDGEFEFQANEVLYLWLSVRQNKKDGRLLVYGGANFESRWAGARDYKYRSGYLLDPNADIASAIFRVADELVERGASEQIRTILAHECVAKLPAESI